MEQGAAHFLDLPISPYISPTSPLYLTSWNKAPLTLAVKEGFNLLFRNLDATATLLRAVDLRGQTIQNVSTCTGYSMLGQMGVQKFHTVLSVGGD